MLKRSLFLLSVLLSNTVRAADILVTAPRELESFSPASKTTVLEVKDSDLSVSDVLKHSSGSYLSQSYGLKDSTLSLRGFSSTQVKVLIDGIALESTGFTLEDIPIASVEKIIVSRGPMSSLYGNSAMGGVVNVLTKRNFDTTKVSASYGSFASIDIRTQTASTFENTRYYLVPYYKSTNGRYRYHRDNSLFDPGTSDTFTVENNAQESFGTKTGFQYKNVHCSLSLNQRDRGIPGMVQKPTLHIHERSRDYRFVVNFEDYAWIETIHSDFTLFESAQFTTHKDPLGEVNGFAEVYTNSTRSRGGSVKGKFLISEFIIPTVRIDFQSDEFADPHLHKKRNSATLALSTEIYFQDLTLSPSTSRSYASALPQEQSYGMGFVYAFTPEFSLKSQVGSSFRYPTFEELFLARGFTVGNANLEPEKSLGGDFGILWNGSRFQGELTYFEYHTRNLIDYELASGFQYKPYNFRKAKTRGFEWEMKLSKLYGFSYSHAITWQEVRDDERDSANYGNFLPMKPWLYGSNTLDYDLHANIPLHYVFSFAKSRFVNRSNTLKLADNYSSDVGISWKLNSFSTRFDIRNLFNRDNVDVRGFPLPGRSYYLSLEIQFL